MSQTALRDKLRRFIDGNWPGAKRIQGLQGGARAYVLALAAESARRPVLVISPTARQAEDLYTDVSFFLGEDSTLPPVRKRLHLLPPWEVLPFEKLSPHPDNIAARLEALYKLIEEPAPIRRGTGEETIHGWRQPEQAQVVAHLLDAPCRRAVDAHAPPALAQCEPRAHIGRPRRRLNRYRHRPAAVRAVRRKLLEGTLERVLVHVRAGERLAAESVRVDRAFTSTLRRAIETGSIVLDVLAFSAVVWALRHGETSGATLGFLLGLAYSTARGYGGAHPFVGELRLGDVEVEIVPEELGFPIVIAEVTVTECQMINQFRGSKEKPPQFTRGYGTRPPAPSRCRCG